MKSFSTGVYTDAGLARYRCRALDDVVRSGKALYVAVSDTPAWAIAIANTTAKLRGWRCALLTHAIKYSHLEH
jgi:aryl-alcohol dehydrogenase-like predicted oxidoreductase